MKTGNHAACSNTCIIYQRTASKQIYHPPQFQDGAETDTNEKEHEEGADPKVRKKSAKTIRDHHTMLS